MSMPITKQLQKSNKQHKSSKKKGLKIFFVASGALILLGFVLFWLLITWAKIKAISYVEKHSEYTLRINSIVFTGVHDLEITGIEFFPKLGPDQFYKVNPVERDMISAKGQLSIEGIDWETLLKEKKIYADRVCFKDADLNVYRDKRMPDGPYKYKPMHSAILRDASFSFTFPLVEVVNSRIEYDEHPEHGSKWEIVFSKLHGILYNLSTDSSYILKHPEVILKGTGLIMEDIEGKMLYKFSTFNTKDQFTFEGHTGPFPATLFNKCITPAANVKVKTGYVKKVDLFFHANDHFSTGTFDMDYNGLEIDFLGKNTAFMRRFIREDDRKRNGKEKKAGEINCIRDRGTSVFNYWWLSIRSGLLSSIVTIKLPPPKKKNRK
jgi:hypothetical protein